MSHISCECGCIVTKKYHPTHIKTNKHTKLMKKKQEVTNVTKVLPKKQEIEEIQKPDEKQVKRCFTLICIVENNGVGGIFIDQEGITELKNRIFEFSVIERASALGQFMAL